jgi:hypothetical protein
MNKPLLSLYEQVDLDAAATQAAILEEVTYTKVLATGAKQGLTTAKGAVKWVANWAGVRAKIDTTPAKTTQELVVDRTKWWSQRNVRDVRKFVVKTLAERLQVDEHDLGTMSTRLIEEAAAGMDVPSDLLLSQQADQIAIKYLKQCEEGIKEKLREQTSDEAAASVRDLAALLDKLTPIERLEIQKSLKLEHLSAKSLRETIMTTGLPIAGIAGVQAAGFGAYLALTTVMHAVFTSMLGITLPFAAYTTATSALSLLTGPAGVTISLGVGFLGYFWGRRKIERSQYAMIVATCVWRAQGPTAPPTRELPSARVYKLLGDGSSSTLNVPRNETEDFESLEWDREKALQAQKALEHVERQAGQANSAASLQENLLKRAEDRLAEITSRSYTDQALQASLKQQFQDERKRRETLVTDLAKAKLEAEGIRERLADAKREQERLEALHVSRRERRSKELKQLWAIHFPKVDFQPQPLRWAAEQDWESRLEIERALAELARADDPVTLSRSKIHTTHEHHSGFMIAGGVPCRLFYKVVEGRIDVRKMCKKKDV